MSLVNPNSIENIALINFGGIGDEILFSPVLKELKDHLPHVKLTLILERRSQSVLSLLPGVDQVIPLDIQGTPKPITFLTLLKALKSQPFDAVISAGSSPFIPLLLRCSGIPIRVGFQTGAISRRCLTWEAPLNKKQYAGEMYFALAKTFLSHLWGQGYQPPSMVLPALTPPPEAERRWAVELIPAYSGVGKNLLIHPGVSQVSLQKGILKTWSPESWAVLIQQLVTQQHQVYLVGGPDDAAIIEAILQQLPAELTGFTNLYGRTKNLTDLSALIAQADMLISVDSSPLHIAVGLNKPVVALFGPTDEKKLLPNQPHFQAVTKADLACRPCLWDVRQRNCETSDCLKIEITAMQQAIHKVISTL